MKKILSAAAFAMLATVAAPVSATTISVEQQNPDNVFADADGNNAWRVVTDITIGTDTRHVYAGAFRLKSNGAGPLAEFLAFCLEPLQTLSLPNDHEVGSLFSETINTNLNRLAQNAWGLITNSETAAAFQMAAWELTTETNSSFDIATGNFSVGDSVNAGSDGARELAQDWLMNLNDNTWMDNGQDYIVLNYSGSQDLLTNVAAVPLPASGLLLIGGLFGAGAVARRKSRQA